MKTLYCGIDLHKNFSAVCIMDQNGQIMEESKLLHRGDMLKEYFHNKEPMECVVEPVENWGWITDYLQELGHKVHLANTYKVRLIAESRVKTDRVDARILANLLRTGYLPEGYLAPIELRDRRTYFRYRIRLTRDRARLKNQVRRLLRVENVEEPKCADMFGKIGRKWLEDVKLRSVHDRIKGETLEIMDLYDEFIKAMQMETRKDSKEDENINRLSSVPGIGELTAQVIMSEVGDMRRFPTAKHFAGYTGLSPSEHSSGGKISRGHITKTGNKHIRWLLVEAAHVARRYDVNLGKYFDRIAFKKGRAQAAVALARKLAEISWHVVIDQVNYDTNKVCRHFG